MMLTFLSRSIRQLVSTAGPQGAAREPVAPSPAPLAALVPTASPAPARPALRLVRAKSDRDIAITAACPGKAAPTFIAGEGARLYSLDAFRSTRTGPASPTPATPRAA